MHREWLSFALLVAATLTPARGGGSPALRLTGQVDLPIHAVDVRWDSTTSLLLAARAQGVFRLEVGDETPAPAAPPAPFLPAPTSFLGFASTGLARAAPFRGEVVYAGPEGSRRQAFPFLGVMDIDLDSGRLLVLGMRAAPGDPAPQGEIAWLFDLRSGVGRPILFSQSGPGAPAIVRCGLLATGAVRFLRDGGFVVAPGIDDGIRWFDPEGRLKRVWTSAELGLDTGCPLSADEAKLFAQSSAPRPAWLDARRVVDEILATPAGPVVVVRSTRDGTPVWSAILLDLNGNAHRFPLPIPGPEPGQRLKGDARENRVVLLVEKWVGDAPGSRLLWGEWAPAEPHG